MKPYTSATLLILSLVSPADAIFGGLLGVGNILRVFKQPPSFLDVAKYLGTQALRKRTKIEVLDDVHLPLSVSIIGRVKNFLDLERKTNRDVAILGACLLLDKGLTAKLNELVGTEKPKNGDEGKDLCEIFRHAHAMLTNDIIKVHPNDPDPCAGYLYFGNSNYVDILPKFCRTNPFFANALTLSKDKHYLELIAYSPEPETDNDALYLSLCRQFADYTPHKINARFNRKMEIVEITKYDNEGQKEIVAKKDWNYYASGIMYNMYFHASATHTVIHILHYLMCSGIIVSTQNDKSLKAWADPYNNNISMKYVQVAVLLLEAKIDKRPFGSGLKVAVDVYEDRTRLPKTIKESLKGKADTSYKLVSGELGFGASNGIMPILKNMICIWGDCKTADEFMTTYLLKNLYEGTGATRRNRKEYEELIDEAGILTEFRKHVDIVPSYASDMTKAMKSSRGERKAFAKAEKTFHKFMKECGKGVFSIGTIDSFIQLMSITGIMHGSTLSYTRAIFAPEVIRWRTKKDTFECMDAAVLNSLGGTMQGMVSGRHVFSSKMQLSKKWNTKPISKNVFEVMQNFDAKAEALKEVYQKEVVKSDGFREYGWILTDYCTDGYDGKQHTIATYI